MRLFFVSVTALCLVGAHQGLASSYSASQMWGTDASGVSVNGAYESAVTHEQNGIIAGQVNAARAGLLMDTGSGAALTIQSIGSQTVISSTVNGSNNNVDIDGQQSSSNSGQVSNDGTIQSNY